MASTMPDTWYREQAREQYVIDGEIEVDDNAIVSRNDDPDSSGGAYIQAWVWVYDPDADQQGDDLQDEEQPAGTKAVSRWQLGDPIDMSRIKEEEQAHEGIC